MATTTIETFCYPNKIGRIIFFSMEEILGRDGLNAVLNLSVLPQYIDNYPPNNMDQEFEFESLGRIHESMENLYGLRGGRGLALRTGRVCMKYGLPEFGPLMGVNDMAFRLLPVQMKLRAGAEAFARTFSDITGQPVVYAEEAGRVLWVIERCPICWGRQTSHPACHLAVGLLQEAIYWISGGRYFNVEEVSCIARGDETCTIAIDKEPID